MKYEFNEQEVKALKGLIDIAIKAAGIQVAEAGVVLSKKLDNPITEIKPVETTTA